MRWTCFFFTNFRLNRDKREREYEDRKSRSDTRDRKRKKKSRWGDETDDVDERGHAENHSKDRRMTKTLDGKIAGLQNAKALREETEIHKRREIEQFNEVNSHTQLQFRVVTRKSIYELIIARACYGRQQ